jgi:Flp pilus assembly protein protease CpaA
MIDYFLASIVFVWLFFAAVQDIRTREISNWLNFSLIALALGYKGFEAVSNAQASIFLNSLVGVVFFVALGHVFYYAKIFAGGDAKLLFAMGAVLPYESLYDVVSLGLTYVFILFFSGMIYTLIYTGFMALKRRDEFKREFNRRIYGARYFVLICLVLGVFFTIWFLYVNLGLVGYVPLILGILPVLVIYSKAVEAVVMVERVNPKDLTEGDWLEKNVRIGNKLIKKSVHGLSINEIKFLRRKGKSVWIKNGVPFAPAFLISYIIFLFFKEFFYLI